MKILITPIMAACVALFCIVASATDPKEETIEALKSKASKGDPKAQYSLAIDYIIRENPVEGNKWLRKAAEQGYPDAQLSLGLRIWHGQGTETDLVEAARWLKLAALVGKETRNLGSAAQNLAGVIREMTQEQRIKAGVDMLVYFPPPPEKDPIAVVSDRKLIRNIDVVGVSAEIQSYETNSFIKEKLQTIVELRLRTAGIKIKEKEGKSSGPIFRVSVQSVHSDQSHLSCFTVQGAIVDEMKYNGYTVLGVSLWEHRSLWYVGDQKYENAVIDATQQIVDQFANDYLAANPKQ